MTAPNRIYILPEVASELSQKPRYGHFVEYVRASAEDATARECPIGISPDAHKFCSAGTCDVCLSSLRSRCSEAIEIAVAAEEALEVVREGEARLSLLLNERAQEAVKYQARAEAAEATVKALFAEIADHEHAARDKRRLAREIDVALHGEDGAAQQASLCDLVTPARELRSRVEELEAQNAELLRLNDIYRSVHRWSVESDGNGRLLVCKGQHEKGDGCQWEVFVPVERVASLEAQNEALKEAHAEIDGYVRKAEDALAGVLLTDGRPCQTDVFIAKLFDDVDDHFDRMEAVQAWLEGAWDEALDWLSDEARAALQAKK